MILMRKTVLQLAFFVFAVVLVSGCGGEKQKSVELEEYVFNLDEPTGSRYLKLKLKLVLDNAEAVAEINTSEAEISDALITFISTKRVDDLRSSLGKKQLKRELLDLFNNKLVHTGKASDIYFMQFVIQ